MKQRLSNLPKAADKDTSQNYSTSSIPPIHHPWEFKLHLPGESDGATKWSSRLVANEPHCPLGHDKPLKHQLIPEVATEKGGRPAFSDGLLPEDARLTQPGPPSAPPQTGWAQQRRWLLQEKLLKPLSPSCQHMPQKFYESSPRMPRSIPPQEPPYFLPLRSTSGTVARKDHGSSQAQRQVSLPFAGCRLPSSAPPRQPTRSAQLHFRRTRRWQWERRGRRQEAADRRLRLRFMAALPPSLGSVGSGGVRGGPEPELASRVGTCARRRWGAACEEETASSARRASQPGGMATTAELFEVSPGGSWESGRPGCGQRGGRAAERTQSREERCERRGVGWRLRRRRGRSVKWGRGGLGTRVGRWAGKGTWSPKGGGLVLSAGLEGSLGALGVGRCTRDEKWERLTQGAERGASSPRLGEPRLVAWILA